MVIFNSILKNQPMKIMAMVTVRYLSWIISVTSAVATWKKSEYFLKTSLKKAM